MRSGTTSQRSWYYSKPTERMLILILSRSPDIAVLDWSDSLLMPRALALSSLAHHTYLCQSSTSNTLTVK